MVLEQPMGLERSAGLDMAVRGARDQVQKKTPDVRRQLNNYSEEQARWETWALLFGALLWGWPHRKP